MKKLLFAVGVVLLSLGFLNPAGAAEMKKFDGTPYNLAGNLWVLQEIRGDVVISEYEDTVRVIGELNEANDMAERLWLEIQLGAADSSRPRPFIVDLPENFRGYGVEAELKSFVMDEGEQVFLAFRETPDGAPRYAVIHVAVEDQSARVLFYSGAMARAILSGEFIGKYRATLHVFDTSTSAVLDLSARKDFYHKEGIYSNRGKILKPVAISAKRYETVTLGEPDKRGIYLLNTTIELFGANAEDHLATLECAMMYNTDFEAWRLVACKVVPAQDIKFMESREEKSKAAGKKHITRRQPTKEEKKEEVKK